MVDHLNLQIQPSKRTHDLLLLLDVILQLKLFDLIEFITVLFIIFEHLKIPHQLQEYGLVVLSEVIMGLLLVQHRLALGFRGIENQSQVLNLLLIDLRVLPVGLYWLKELVDDQPGLNHIFENHVTLNLRYERVDLPSFGLGVSLYRLLLVDMH